MTKKLCVNNKQITRLISGDNFFGILSTMLSSFFLLYISVESFLIMNAFSFLLAAIIICRVDNNDLDFKPKLDEKTSTLRELFLFKNRNHTVFKMIIFMAIISLLFSTFTMILQKEIKFYNLNPDSSGIYIGLFNIISFITSLSVGFIKTKFILENIKRLCILMIICFSITSFLQGELSILFVSVLFGILGGGINTLAMVYIQNHIQINDMIIFKSIYNVFCGMAIIVSGIITPLLLNYLRLQFFFPMISFAFLLAVVFLKKTSGE